MRWRVTLKPPESVPFEGVSEVQAAPTLFVEVVSEELGLEPRS